MKHIVFAILMVAVGCSAAEVSPARPEETLEADEGRLLTLHEQIWNLIGLSPEAAKELNDLVLKLRRNIKYNENRRGELESLIIPGTLGRQSATREQFVENHRKRFALLGISANTQGELFASMSQVWAALHEPGASAEELRRAERIQELMLPSLPPCQREEILEYRESLLRKK